ncbi:hypothetical protein ACI7RC_18775 [Brevibacillus sp. B_LB10_24]|uniref:hypothetical protein n=1 Tax=Brevibacillus sp. B_LB10_24 TaxID=3380645 RepID=UPI0038BC83B5
MPDVFVWGPFIIKQSWILIAGSCLAAYWAAKFRVRGGGKGAESVLETLVNLSILAVFIWKGSLILFHPMSVIDNPYVLLYFSGGVRGVWLALAVALLLLYIRARKANISIWIYADVLTVAFLAFRSVYHVLALVAAPGSTAIVFHVSHIAVSALLLAWFARNRNHFGHPEELLQMLLWFSIGQIFTGFFAVTRTSAALGLTWEQLLFLTLALLCILVSIYKHRSRL